VVTGYVKVAPKDRAAFVAVLRAHVPRALKKDGCIAYAFAADLLDPNVVRMRRRGAIGNPSMRISQATNSRVF
jgi:quinol monooxygenase YgiN